MRPSSSSWRAAAGAAGATLADQAVASAASLLMVVAVAQRLTPEAFGGFAIAYAALVVALACCRAWLGMPVALSTPLAADERRRLLGGACLLVVAAAPVVVAGVGVALPAALSLLGTPADGGTFLVVAVAAVLACLHDLTRYAAVASGRPVRALASDAARLIGVGLLLVAPASLPPGGVLLAWLAIVAASAAVGLCLVPPSLSLRHARRLVATGGRARSGATVVALLASGTALALSTLVAAGFSAAASGSLLGAGTLLGPVNLLLALLDLAVLGRLVGVPEDRRRRILGVVLGAVWIAQLAWTVLLLGIPSSIGEAVLGSTWSGARAILPIVSAEYAVAAAIAVVSLELKVRDVGVAMVAARLAACVVVLGGTAGLAAAAASFALVPVVMLAGSVVGLAVVLVGVAAASRRAPAGVGVGSGP
ncbi:MULTISPECIES: hypothetical protein [unclassified Agrococcus]|uniref:hypothetical protein n=1 Tax=unclassified Agrococcus TaxID=2615065 RepID=UPI0036061ADE